jgi:flagellin
MDDAAGLQIATRLKYQTSGMTVAMRNTQNSISMMQTAEGALDEVTNMLVRMKDLATQASDGSSTDADRTAMQAEFDALGKELTNIVANTSFGGTSLLGTKAGSKFGAGTAVTFQIGTSSSETMSVDLTTELTAMNTVAWLAHPPTSALTALTRWRHHRGHRNRCAAANTAIDKLAAAIDNVSTVRSALGAVSNRLDHVYNNLANVSTNTKAATGRIMDTDFAPNRRT